MVQVSADPSVAVVDSVHAAQLGESPAAAASIANYLAAGDSVATLMNLTWKLCAGLLVLIAAAWVLGVLPGAVRLV